MKKNLRNIILIALISIMSAPASQAQTVETNDIFYHSFRSPWATWSNPALFPKNAGFFVALPQLDFSIGLPVSYSEMGLTYSEQAGKTYVNLNTLLDNIEKGGAGFTPNLDINLLGVGFRAGKHLHFTLSAGVHTSGIVYFPTEITNLLDGNMNNGELQTVNISQKNLTQITAYANTSLGVSYNIGVIPLTIGVRGNVLFGLEYVSLKNIDINLVTLPEMESLYITADYLGQTAGLAYLEKDADGNNSFNYNLAMPSSIGYTFDFGLHYQLKNFDFSLSMLNIGPGITWKDNVYTITPKNPDKIFSFEGITASMGTEGINIDTAALSTIGDSLLASMDYKTTAGGETIITTLPTKLYGGISYSIGNWARIGYLFHGEWLNGLKKDSKFVCNNTLSVYGNLFDWLEIGVANSFTFDGGKADYLNPGISASINLGRVFQITAAVDYVSNLYATQIKSAHVMLGLNIVGYKKTVSEKKHELPTDESPTIE